jgi:hypothetical protein
LKASLQPISSSTYLSIYIYIYINSFDICTHDELLELLDDEELELELEELLEELLLDEDLYTCGHLLLSDRMCIAYICVHS